MGRGTIISAPRKTPRDWHQGPSVFYSGWIGTASRADGGGRVDSKADLAAYQAKARTPIRGKYNGYEIIGMAPPSSGGVAMVEMLNILEQFDLSKYSAFSPQALHLQIEAMRRAYLDRARYLGDPDFVKHMPLDRLMSKTYAKSLAATIDPNHASSSAELGKDLLATVASNEHDETTHFSIVDKWGNAVSNTFTLEGGFGSHVVVSPEQE